MSSNKDPETKGIHAVLVLEMIGRPPEYLNEAMSKVITNIDEEKGVEVLSKKINDPVQLKDNKEFFSTFAEVDIKVEEIANLAILMFKYMPAHIEILQPELIALTNNGWSDILSELVRRLHGYDEVARVLDYQNQELKKKIEELTKGKVSDNKTEEKPNKKDKKSKKD